MSQMGIRRAKSGIDRTRINLSIGDAADVGT
jgi:hypothetical protein